MLTAKIAAAAVLAAALALSPARAASSEAGSGARWRWPTVPPGAVVQAFVAPASPYAAGHRGLDLAASPGQAVVAPAAATVQFAGIVVDRPVVTLRVDDHVLLSFEPVASEVPVGATVEAGQRVGAVARGGHCDGSCLHVGVRIDGDYVSPLLFFAGIPPAVLLPFE
ncbi:peptidoglycan DD-metalloendopeptidase family protein [Gryllotalpicola protaetiae]|nr:peptidoglycan DD-metalloendopeptidase family protein [Gryllotalpicola protaetiae]